MKAAVVTIVHGRGTHLRRQLQGLAMSSVTADIHIVVALGDPGVADVVAREAAPAAVINCPADHPLPLAHGRNIGAAAAIQQGAELLVFLDVDCIPGPRMIERYHQVAVQPEHRDALLCGTVTYLPPPGPLGYDLRDLQHRVRPHPARPTPPSGAVFPATDYSLFWSLAFAVSRTTWRRIGGFCELYRGYGGEDTDFAYTAASAAVPMRWVGGADAFHQYHPVTDPPLQHLHDIVRNAAVFHQRWGWWPMHGWLTAFEDRGLITRDPEGRPQIVAAQPATAKQHPRAEGDTRAPARPSSHR